MNEKHLRAALEIWRYCDDSARYIFGDALGDETADEIYRLLTSRPEGITRTEMMEHFKRHKTSGEIERALSVLERECRGVRQTEETGGRPREVWFRVHAR